MRLFALVGFGVFAGSTLLAGQQPGAGPNPPKVLANGNQIIVLPPMSACPVLMQARQGSSSQMVRADDGTSQPLMTPTLILTPEGGRKIVTATVTAHGRPNEGGTLDLVARKTDPDHPAKTPEITKTVTIKPVPGERGGFSAKLQLPGFTTVRFIHLDSVTYDDGATWKFASGCTVTPDPLLLISGR